MEDLTFDEILGIIIIIIVVCIGYFLKDKKKGNGKENIDDLIKNDSRLQEIDKEIGRLNKEAGKMLTKDRKTLAKLKAQGFEIDEDPDWKFDKTEVLNDFKETLFADTEGFAMPAPDEILDFVNERLMWEKRITKSNYSKIESMVEKWENFLNDEYDDFQGPMPDDFEDAEEYEKELKKVETKKKNFNSKDTKIRNQILKLLSKALED
jgi:peptidoglycan hydrolase CwlO-like protein